MVIIRFIFLFSILSFAGFAQNQSMNDGLHKGGKGDGYAFASLKLKPSNVFAPKLWIENGELYVIPTASEKLEELILVSMNGCSIALQPKNDGTWLKADLPFQTGFAIFRLKTNKGFYSFKRLW